MTAGPMNLALNPDAPMDTADYGGSGNPDTARGPDETGCRRCGCLAIEHTEGRFSIYGTCPTIDLDAIEARANAATDGPWYVDEIGKLRVFGPNADALPAVIANKECDAEFAAHARQDVPALLAEVRRLRAEVADASNGAEDSW